MRWCNDPSLDLIVSRPTSPRRRFLVFAVPRSDFASPFLQLPALNRNFDLAVRFYSEPGANSALLDEAEFVMTGGLSKFHAAALFIEACQLQQAYEGILFLDGDLEFDVRQLSNFLSFVQAAGLDLAQPSVTRDSFCYWNVAYRQPRFVFRETSFVEVMAPYLSQRALARTLPTFSQSISTYGLDLVWPFLIEDVRIGVIDAFPVRHRETVNHASGAFYNYLRSIGVDLDEEERQILARYGVAPEHAHSKRGYLWNRSWPLSRTPEALVSIPLPGIERNTRRQYRIDLSMWLASTRNARTEDELTRAVGPYLSGKRIRGQP